MLEGQADKGMVLVVHGKPAVRAVLAEAFALKGWSVIEAMDGEEGARLAWDNRPDLMVLSMCLPKKCSRFVLEELNKGVKMQFMNVIVLGGASCSCENASEYIGQRSNWKTIKKGFGLQKVLDVAGSMMQNA